MFFIVLVVPTVLILIVSQILIKVLTRNKEKSKIKSYSVLYIFEYPLKKSKLLTFTVEESINFCKKNNITCELKKEVFSVDQIIIFSVVCSVFLSLLSTIKLDIFSMVSIVFLATLALIYFRGSPYQKGSIYNIILCAIWQIGLTFWLTLFLSSSDTAYKDNFFNKYSLFISIFYISISLLFSTLRIRYELSKFIDEKIYHIESKYRLKMINGVFIKLSVFTVVAIVIWLNFYRLNKWWLKEVLYSHQLIQNSSIISILFIIVWILVLTGLTLLPTLIFSPKKFIQGYFIQKYPEAFRKEYDFTKEEWYGEE